MALDNPFERYIFCEVDDEQLGALRSRADTLYGASRDVHYLSGDVNDQVEKILQIIPRGSPSDKVLTLCFADPYNLKDLRFETLKRLSERYMDFLVLIASDMDANRNLKLFVKPDNHVVEDFTGDPNWRSAWGAARSRNQTFGDFVADHFIHQMTGLGYLLQPLPETHRMRSTEKNLPLYRLALLSRHTLGAKFFKESKKYSTDQKSIF